MTGIVLYVGAALAEIAGCFAFWAVLRQQASFFWLIAGMIGLVAFAVLLTKADVEHAGRAFAVYGGIYIAASLMWLWAVEGQTIDRWDIIGAAVSVLGALIILYAPRAAG